VTNQDPYHDTTNIKCQCTTFSLMGNLATMICVSNSKFVLPYVTQLTLQHFSTS